MKKSMIVFLKIISLGILGFISEVIARAVLPPLEIGTDISKEGMEQAVQMLVIFKLICAVAIYYAIRKARAGFWYKSVIMFFTVFGLSAVMTQIETVLFIKSFPVLDLYKVGLIVAGHFVSFLIFMPLAVLITGRENEEISLIEKLEYPAVKILILSFVYLFIYFFFGYFVALRFKAVQEFYKGDPATATFILPLIQIARGGLWVVLILPLLEIIPSYKDKIISSTLLYGFLVGPQLILPNPLMPPMVRLGHFLEVTSSMLLFGSLVAWVLYSPGITGKINQMMGKKDAAKSPV